jgi:hypothetical protein
MPTNHDKVVLQPNKLTKKVRKKKEPEKEQPHEMSEHELYVQEKMQQRIHQKVRIGQV